MKDNLQVILFAVLFALVGMRLYKKFIKKDGNKPDGSKRPGTSFGPKEGEDEYEPYSKK